MKIIVKNKINQNNSKFKLYRNNFLYKNKICNNYIINIKANQKNLIRIDSNCKINLLLI